MHELQELLHACICITFMELQAYSSFMSVVPAVGKERLLLIRSANFPCNSYRRLSMQSPSEKVLEVSS